jgi:hypothetical protein
MYYYNPPQGDYSGYEDISFITILLLTNTLYNIILPLSLVKRQSNKLDEFCQVKIYKYY